MAIPLLSLGQGGLVGWVIISFGFIVSFSSPILGKLIKFLWALSLNQRGPDV